MVAAALSECLGGCGFGLTVPDMQEPYEAKADEKFYEADLAEHVKCEIRRGVQEALTTFSGKDSLSGNSVEWIREYIAKVTMKLTVDEKTSVSPGVSINKPLQNAITYFRINGNVTTPQSFTSTMGLQASSEATRVETITYQYDFSDWFGTVKKPRMNSIPECERKSSILLLSDLKIRDFIINKVSLANSPAIVSGKISDKAPFSVFSDQITFVVLYGGNFTPFWKLVDVTGSTNSPFLNTTRTKTQDVTIAIGSKANPELEALHNAQLIGQEVAAALKSQQR